MKSILLITALFSVIFTGCELGQKDSSYSYQEEFHNKYEKKLKEDPNYKLNVKDLNIQQDIDDNSIFCYSSVNTPKEKMQKLIEGLRGIPIDCNGGIDTSGSYSCLLENEVLDSAAKDNSIADASGDNTKSLKERAQENGYDAKFVVGGAIVQNDLSEKSMILAVEKKMKNDANFCSYVVSKRTKDLGVAYEDNNGKRYWSIILGDDIK